MFILSSLSSSSRQLQAQKVRLARSQGPYYGGSLPNVNQIGRSPQDFQVTDSHHALTSDVTSFIFSQLVFLYLVFIKIPLTLLLLTAMTSVSVTSTRSIDTTTDASATTATTSITGTVTSIASTFISTTLVRYL